MEKYKYLDDFNEENNIPFNILNYTKNELFIINNILSKNKLDNIIDTNSSNILRYIGLIYYLKKNKVSEAKEYYLMAIKLNNSDAMNSYALLLEEENKVSEAKEYYLMAINLNNSSAMNNYAFLLEEENKLEEAKKYYLMAINLNNKNSMYNYACLLEEENKIEEAKKYYLMAINLNNKNALHNYLLFFKSNIEKYIKLCKLDSNVLIVKKRKIKLLENKDIRILKNKIDNFSKIDNCNICYNENKLNIILNCFNHYVCDDCYIQLYNEKCPFCRD